MTLESKFYNRYLGRYYFLPLAYGRGLVGIVVASLSPTPILQGAQVLHSCAKKITYSLVCRGVSSCTYLPTKVGRYRLPNILR